MTPVKISALLTGIILPVKNLFTRSIAVKIALYAWLMVILSIVLYVIFSFPFQKTLMTERMRDEAEDIARSILHANSSALIAEEYQFTVDHCVNLVAGSSSIVYIVISKNDGFSLIFKKDGWRTDSLGHPWSSLSSGAESYGIVTTPYYGDEVFQYSRMFNYSGINWGYIHIGLSLNSYNQAVESIRIRALILILLLTVIASVASFLFARKFSRPIRELDRRTRKIADGDLETRSEIATGDELQSLSESFNKMTSSLKSAREDLEARVRERTSELAETNEVLLYEIQERLKAEEALNRYAFRLKALEEVYRGLIAAKTTKEIVSSTVIHLKNLLPFNRANLCVYDYEKNEVVTHSFTEKNNVFLDMTEIFRMDEFGRLNSVTEKEYLIIDDLPALKTRTYIQQKLFEEGQKSLVQVLLRYQGEEIGEFNFASADTYAFDEKHIDIILEVTQQLAVAVVQVTLQEKLKIHAAELQNSLKEKVVLLKEIHHRVKNNLQIVSSLLYLQSRTILDAATLDILKDGQSRVKSMALVHEKLYHSKDLALIEFADYIQNLTAYVFNNYKEAAAVVKVVYDLDNVSLSIDSAIPLGLILNELISNALKYAFCDKSAGAANELTIRLKSRDHDQFLLSVRDNGKGLPEHFDLESLDSLGLKLVVNLVQQINGKLILNRNGYTEFVIEFRESG